MKKVFISSKLFDTKYRLRNVIRGIIMLNDNGYEIFTDKKNPYTGTLIPLLEKENVHLNTEFENVKFDYILSTGDEKDKTGIHPDADFELIVKNLINYSDKRTAEIQRNTKETQIYCSVNLDGEGKSKINTGIGFFDHMLEQISRHGNVDLEINVKGDLRVDEHHTVEDTGLALGEAINKALGDKKGIKRYGFLLPMDDSVAEAAVDLGGRPYLNFKAKFKREKIGEFPTELVEEYFRAVSVGMKANIYIKAKGKNEHHKIEAIFKSFAKALNEAFSKDERNKNKLPSTKGAL